MISVFVSTEWRSATSFGYISLGPVSAWLETCVARLMSSSGRSSLHGDEVAGEW